MVDSLVFKQNFLSFKQYAKISLRYMFKARPTRYLLLVPVVGAIFFWSQPLWNGNTFSALLHSSGTDMWILTGLGLLFPISMWRGLKKNYQAARFMHSPADYQFSATGLDCNSPLLQSHSSWAVFHSFYDLGAYGVLMTSNLTGFFLDFAVLQPPATKRDFLNLLKQHHIGIK